MKICVFSGGAGTRMWPLSRRKKPKQFQLLIGNKSLFQLMVGHLKKGFDLKDIYVVTGKEYKSWVNRQVPEIPQENLILEPQMRDTTAAVGFAATFLDKKFPGEVMAVIWGADHLVKNEEEFIKALKAAEKLAQEKGAIIRINVRPSFPSVHLGYVQIGKKISDVSGFEVFEFIRHKEKPILKKAKEFLASKDHLWNTGYLVSDISTIIKLYEKHTPHISRILKEVQGKLGDEKKEKELAKTYAKIPKVSIDYAIFEKLTRGEQLVILADLDWKDIGAWDVLKDELSKGKKANVVMGNHVGLGTENSLIYEEDTKKMVATVGLQNMIIIDTKDSLLICPASRASDIKKIVAKLAKENKKRYL